MNRQKKLVALAASLLFAPVTWLDMPAVAADGPTKNASKPTTVRPSSTPSSSAKRTANRADTLPRPTRKSNNAVTPASHLMQEEVSPQEVVQEGEIVYEDGHGVGLHGGCDGSCGGSCSSCEGGMSACDLGCCDTCLQPNRLCICLPAHGWAHMEYLMGWTSPMYVPPMVVTGTNTNSIFVGDSNTRVLLGEGYTTGRDTMLSDQRAGGRLRFGWSLGNFPGWGLDAEYLSLGNATETFRQVGTSTSPIAVPFIEMNPNLLQLLYTNSPNGTNESSKITDIINVRAQSRMDGGAFHFRKIFCCNTGCGPTLFCRGTVPTQSKWEGFVGYRFLQLKESIETTYSGTQPVTSAASDYFGTMNQFNGADFGVQWQGRRGFWSSDLMMRMAIGNNHQQVDIRGSSRLSSGTQTIFQSSTTGLLAAESNVGLRERDTFAVIPELGATLGYQLTQRIKLTAGYTFIYWSRVVRPGEQIDREINSLNNGFLTNGNPQNPRINPIKPQFEYKESDYWVQGLSLGGEYRW
ncbi:MAG: BBP7 family outer membrane beta-barrel protein [Pirellulales bacterium]